MILQALAHLAEREALVDDPSYEPAAVAYLISLGPGGRYRGVVPVEGTQELDKKGRPKGKPKLPARPVPRRSDRTSAPKAEFLVDKAEYVFGVDPKGKRAEKQLATRKALFLDRVSYAARALSLPSLAAVEAFLRGPIPPEIEALLHPAKESEKSERAGALFAFLYEPDGGVACVHDDPRVRTWFAQQLDAEENPVIGQCLVTGEPSVVLTRLHAKPKGIPPKSLTKGGVPITSTNASAFTSYGLDHIGCAPISRTANIAVETALNRLLDPAWKAPSGETCQPRSLAINPETAFLYWSREDAGIDWLNDVDSVEPEAVAALLRSPYKSHHAPIDDPSDFYGLILSGMQGRAIVRSFLTSTVQDVARAMDRYRDEAAIVKPYGHAAGGFSLYEYRRALAPLREVKRLAPALGVDLYTAILFGRRFPRSVLQAIVSRNRVEFLPRKEKGDARDEMLLAARCSLLKAYLNRNEKENFTVPLDRTRP
ncbi:MAG TPA: type I-C CRISPR-associated protein Cas8c/Csd1, partial [Thermoanaerobaculia bacterium]|nr:type I-C CRISPR-associated protein Cas8c/Csd1 [Thermoanaerobaculia bacterium]